MKRETSFNRASVEHLGFKEHLEVLEVLDQVETKGEQEILDQEEHKVLMAVLEYKVVLV